MDGRRGVATAMLWRLRATALFVVCCCCCAMAATDGHVRPLCPDDGGCRDVRCPVDRDACPLGLVPDGCSCCPYGVCGLGETSVCDTIGRPCADHLECVNADDDADDNDDGTTTSTRPTVYRCACKDKQMACGSDNRTYSNACRLIEAVNETNGSVIYKQYSGPCQSAPVVRSAPKNFAGSVGQPVVFDCEVYGYPVASVGWRFTDERGITEWLPGDDTVMTIQTRGGPDRFTVSSWVQILEFKPGAHAGNYTCVGTNSVDTSAASATLRVRNTTTAAQRLVTAHDERD